MPTGYTAAIIEEKEISFKEFALNCSRAFGALISMRDEPRDAKIPDEFQVSDYHLKELENAKQRLNEFKALSNEDYEKKAKEEFERELAEYEKRIKKNEFTYERYSDMLKKVRGWKEPSEEHKGLKDFMIEQIESSINFDIYEPKKPVIRAGVEWANEKLTTITRDIEYHTRHYKEEVERVESKNKWVKQLRESLEV